MISGRTLALGIFICMLIYNIHFHFDWTPVGSIYGKLETKLSEVVKHTKTVQYATLELHMCSMRGYKCRLHIHLTNINNLLLHHQHETSNRDLASMIQFYHQELLRFKLARFLMQNTKYVSRFLAFFLHLWQFMICSLCPLTIKSTYS